MSSTTNINNGSIRKRVRARTSQVEPLVRLRSSGNAGRSPAQAPARPSAKLASRDSLSIEDLEVWVQKYVRFLERKSDGSLITARDRLALAGRLLCFLRERQHTRCGSVELEEYFFGLSHRHTLGKGQNGSWKRPLSPESIASYYRNPKPMFAWFVEQKILVENPLGKVDKPKSKPPQKEPLPQWCVDELIAASRLSRHPQRDEALLIFLLDTGCRNSEVCALQLNDINLRHGYAQVTGKGNKKRPVYFTSYTAEKIEKYLSGRRNRAKGSEPLFTNSGGQPFTKDGLCDVVKRIAKRAGVSSLVTVHAFRRTFAVEMLRNNAHLFLVQRALGHEDLKTTQVYSKIAQSDVEQQHRSSSPVLRLMKTTEAATNSESVDPSDIR